LPQSGALHQIPPWENVDFIVNYLKRIVHLGGTLDYPYKFLDMFHPFFQGEWSESTENFDEKFLQGLGIKGLHSETINLM
jgi:hypothetical protein